MRYNVFNPLMEQERDEHIKVGNYERNHERTSHRNGYHEGGYSTRIGHLPLRVPRT
ncbi:transposase [Peptococcus simiae]|uniref:Transposase n=1 Tax=Peptococcus simiae TaxID=1643805 RepID=A0ABW9GZ53_9FIRM